VSFSGYSVLIFLGYCVKQSLGYQVVLFLGFCVERNVLLVQEGSSFYIILLNFGEWLLMMFSENKV